MTIVDRRLPSAMLLPAYPQDFDGVTINCAEPGVDTYTSWTSCGGEWAAQGASYVGVTANLPSATKMRLGTRAIIDETAPGGLTRPPSGGTYGVKMKRIELIVKYASDGTTKVWRPNGTQILFQDAGQNGSPIQSFATASAASGVISEFGQIPATLFSQLIGCKMFANVWIGRSTALNTMQAAFTVGPTPGTAGNTFAAVTGVAANVAAVAAIACEAFIAASAVTQVNVALTPNATGQIAATGKVTNDWTAAQTLQASFASATGAETFTLLEYCIGLM